MRQPPLRQGIGREALVKNSKRRREPRVVQIRKERREVLRHDHGLEDQGRRREAGHIEVGVIGLERLLGPTPRKEELAVKARLVEIQGHAVDEDLLDMRQGLQCLRAAGVRVRGDLAPARDLEPFGFELHQQSAPRLRGAGRVGVQKNEAGGKQVRQIDGRLLRKSAQKFLRLLEEEAAAVAGLAVARHRAPMGEAVQRGHCRLDQPMARLVIQLGDQPKAAAIPFIGVAEQAPVGGTHGRPLCLTWLMSVLHRSAGG